MPLGSEVFVNKPDTEVMCDGCEAIEWRGGGGGGGESQRVTSPGDCQPTSLYGSSLCGITPRGICTCPFTIVKIDAAIIFTANHCNFNHTCSFIILPFEHIWWFPTQVTAPLPYYLLYQSIDFLNNASFFPILTIFSQIYHPLVYSIPPPIKSPYKSNTFVINHSRMLSEKFLNNIWLVLICK